MSDNLGEDYAKVYLDEFVEQGETLLQQLQEAVEACEYQKIKDHAHALKGSFAYLENPAATDILHALEMAAESHDGRPTEFEFEKVMKLFREVQREVEQILLEHAV